MSVKLFLLVWPTLDAAIFWEYTLATTGFDQINISKLKTNPTIAWLVVSTPLKNISQLE
jgi:hypothetical protein